MDDPVTSHPFYWAGFALIGDGSRSFLPENANLAANGMTSAATAKAAMDQ